MSPVLDVYAVSVRFVFFLRCGCIQFLCSLVSGTFQERLKVAREKEILFENEKRRCVFVRGQVEEVCFVVM